MVHQELTVTTVVSEFNSKQELLAKAYKLAYTAASMAKLYEDNKQVTAKYVHATSRGHEAVQIAAGLLLKPEDFAYPYYRDDAMLLAMGLKPYELMLQLMAKRDDPFSGGRTYYSHPSLKREGFPTIPHQSSATGMQAIPATGAAQGIAYKESQKLTNPDLRPLVLCSLGDGSVTEGEVAEALQMAVLKRLPIVFLVQDNGWSISASADEFRKSDAYEYAAGFKYLERRKASGTDFLHCYEVLDAAFSYVRSERAPILVQVQVPLLGHHTSGVRKEWYRGDSDLAEHNVLDPLPRLRRHLVFEGFSEADIEVWEKEIDALVEADYQKALISPDPEAQTATLNCLAPTPATEEIGERSPIGGEKVIMVDAALHAIDEILATYPSALLYGQDVGHRLGGVFREAALLARKYGDQRVFNTPIQEAYIVGSTIGMAAAGTLPIVEIQFADYFYPALNQLVTELSKSYYLSNGKFSAQVLIRLPIGAYGSGGPYHSGSIETILCHIKGVKVVYPSNAADMKGLMKAAFLDPNPVIMLEHKGLYWSKVANTEDAKCIEPDAQYILPLGKALVVENASAEAMDNGVSCTVITYGMGVYWAKAASKAIGGNKIEIIDLRTLSPLDFETVKQSVNRHGKVLVLSEEGLNNSFAQALAGRIAQECFTQLDAPVATLGAKEVPAIPLNSNLEREVLPNAEKVVEVLKNLLDY